jgi:hypothetical protein
MSTTNDLRPTHAQSDSLLSGIDTNLPATTIVTVKPVVPVRLYPGATSEAALRDTLALYNQAPSGREADISPPRGGHQTLGPARAGRE